MTPSPERIAHLGPNEIFVFGSNLAGRHGRGAAKLAAMRFGARPKQGSGPSGQSYALATKDHKLRTLPLWRIAIQVGKFLFFAHQNPAFTFLVTQVGCGLAGYKPKQIAPLFEGAGPNVRLPQSFVEVLRTRSTPPSSDTPASEPIVCGRKKVPRGSIARTMGKR